MTVIKVRDHAGNERSIRSLDDWERLVGEVERRRDELADLMLGSDPAEARKAEEQSDFIEETVVTRLRTEASRVQAMIDEEAAIAHRHAKARAIKTRNVTDA